MELYAFHRDIMPRPKLYVVFQGPHYLYECDDVCHLSGHPEYTIWIDRRHDARMRLYNHLLKKCGVSEPKYDPFFGDKEIGVTKPILNF